MNLGFHYSVYGSKVMASVEMSSSGGQPVGSGTAHICYCFDCDSTLTVVATSDSGLICPNCNSVVLEEFETPPSSPLPPISTTTLIDPQSFFPNSDTDDSDFEFELSDLLPPPLPPPPPFNDDNGSINYLSNPPIRLPPLSRSWEYLDYFHSEFRHSRPPSPPHPPPPPSVSAIDRRSQFHVPSSPSIDYRNQYRDLDTELESIRPSQEYLPRSPQLSPSSSSRDIWEYFFHPSTDSEEDTPNQPLPPLSQSTRRDSLNQRRIIRRRRSLLELQPPPPPPWLEPLPKEEGLVVVDMKMTERLVSEWENHQCAICIDDFEINQMVKLLPCTHLYHSNCILRWLDLHKSCPICRCNLPAL